MTNYPRITFDQVFRAANGALVSVWHPRGVCHDVVLEALANVCMQILTDLAGKAEEPDHVKANGIIVVTTTADQGVADAVA